MKKLLSVILAVTLGSIMLVGCNEAKEPEVENDYKYIASSEVKDIIGSDEYVLLDLRKAEDYGTSHIKGSVSADLDPAVSSEDKDTAMSNLKAALMAETSSENGSPDKIYVLLCYSGNRYANEGTDYLRELGIDKEKILILEGGYKEWTGEELESLLV